jgi:membrane protease YdiL (CAAX protease family)
VAGRKLGLRDQELIIHREPMRIHWWWVVGYLVAIVAAELLVVVSPPFGMAGHLILVFALVLHSGIGPSEERPLLLSLVLVPLIRVVSLSLPLAPSSVVYRYFLTSVPLFVAAAVAIRILGFSRRDLGLCLGTPIHQFLIALLSLPLGAVIYLILRPAPLVEPLSLPMAIVAGLILVVSTGFMEELVFRGLLQKSSQRVLGRFGAPYVSAVSAALYIGYRSGVLVACMFLVGLAFAWIVMRTGSLFGVGVAHGLANVVILLVLPLLARQVGLS